MKKRLLQDFVLRFFYKGFCKLFLKIVVGVKFYHTDVFKNEKQFIIVANHNSHLDTLSLMASLPGNMLCKVKPVAAQDYFGKTKLRAALSNYFLNTLLIERSGAKASNPLDKMLEALDAGYSLILFPEGTRSTIGRMEKLKSGIAHLLAQRPQIKYIPAYLSGMGKSLPKGEFLILPYKSSVNFGEAQRISHTDKKKIMEQITYDFEKMEEKYNTKVSEDED